MDKLYQFVVQNATPKSFINTTKINLAIKNINAVKQLNQYGAIFTSFDFIALAIRIWPSLPR